MTAARRVAAVVAAAAVVLTAGGCDGGNDVAELRDEFDQVTSAISADDLDGPTVEAVKDDKFLLGSGTVAGDVDGAADAAVAALGDAGWEVAGVEPVEGGVRVTARSGDVAAGVVFYARRGSTAAPAGRSLVQVSVAPAGSGFAWAD